VACLLCASALAQSTNDQSSSNQASSAQTSTSKPADTPAADQTPKPERGKIEFGVRGVWGDEYGRPDLPFHPSIFTSKYNEYRDVRNGFFIRRGHLILDQFVGTNNYLDIQTDKAIYKDQSYLATFGRWNAFQLQIRYDEIPHTFSNTARTLYTQTTPGVLTISPLLRSTLQGIASSTSLPSTVQNQVVPGMGLYVPQLERRAGSIALTVNLTRNWNYGISFFREHESGARPIGSIFNSSPSAALSGGFGVEIPEPTNYFNNRFVVSSDYGRGDWGVQVSYLDSILTTNVKGVTFDNPFRATDCVAAVTPAACTTATQGPATGRMDTYPDNSAQYVNFAGAFDLTRYLRLMASITPGWLRQNEQFLPYTTNTQLQSQLKALPSSSLEGKKQTLAMNYTLVSRIHKNIELKAQYRHYDYNNDAPVRNFTPVEGDFSIAADSNTPFAYNRKTLDLSGTWFFARKSSWKIGYTDDWMDRSNRDVEHALEQNIYTGLDVNPTKGLNFRVSFLHGDRKPEAYADENAGPDSISSGITEDLAQMRRFDEAPRLRNRGSVQASYDLTDKISVSAFGDTTQDNYNRKGGVNSPTAMNFIAGSSAPYYFYGVLKDLSYDWGFDANYTVRPSANFFAEYSHERYHKRMVSRYRVPGSAAVATPLDCSNTERGCDSANNDWGSAARDFVDIYTAGWDLQIGKRAYLTTYYSLSAAKGHVFSYPLGDPAITTGPNKFLLTGTNAAVDYPETTNRSHEVAAVLKYRLTNNLFPKIEYGYQQFDNKDYQTSAMTPYMGCVSALPPAAATPGCTSPILGTPSPFYPYFVVGDTSATRYLFMGADQPSYRVHYIAGTLEYHF